MAEEEAATTTTTKDARISHRETEVGMLMTVNVIKIQRRPLILVDNWIRVRVGLYIVRKL